MSFTTLFDANLHGGLAKWVRAITAAFGGGSTEKPRHRLSDVRGAAPNIAEELRHEALKATAVRGRQVKKELAKRFGEVL